MLLYEDYPGGVMDEFQAKALLRKYKIRTPLGMLIEGTETRIVGPNTVGIYVPDSRSVVTTPTPPALVTTATLLPWAFLE